MRQVSLFLSLMLLNYSCVSQKELAYLNSLPETGTEMYRMSIPDYKIQHRDLLFITLKAMTADGRISDFLSSTITSGSSSYLQGEAGQFLYGYDVSDQGEILIPVLGPINVGGRTVGEARKIIQEVADKHFNNALAECKLLSFKFTVIGEVRSPGTFVNYNNYLTVLEAVGRAGGLTDYGRRDKILVVRPVDGGTKTYNLNLKEKSILTSEAYFLLPNDVIIIEPASKKLFNLNFSTFSSILAATASVLSTTLLLINYLGNN